MERIRVAQVGLGRLGMHYAKNLHYHVKDADLVAICSLREEELKEVWTWMPEVHAYSSYEEMLDKEKIDAVVIISSTGEHPLHVTRALERGLHVFCEKPLAFSSAECRKVEAVAKKYPGPVIMVGFNRRYDESYRYAMDQVKAGVIGQPFLVRSQTVDMDTVAAFQLQFAKNSGGIFIDYNVHDIDLARWFLDSEIQSVWSLGGAYKFPDFARYGDADYVTTTCHLENGSMACLSAGRVATHGHDTFTEVVGTEGSLRIGRPTAKNRVEILDRQGVRQDSITSFWERFEDAFLAMIVDFIDGVRDGRQSELNLRNARKATEVAEAMTTSYKEGRVVEL